MELKVITLEDSAFYALFDKVIKHLKENEASPPSKWIDGEEAMKLLNIKDSSLRNLRANGNIRYSKALARNILYDRESIEAYLEENARERF